jgi:hypothetical protein
MLNWGGSFLRLKWMKKYSTIGFGCVLALSCLVKSERTKFVGGIEIPEALVASVTSEEWLPNGDGYRVHVYDLDDKKTIDNILHRLEALGSKPLPFGTNEVIDNLIYDYMEEGELGSYLLQNDAEDPRDALLVVWNSTRGQLIVFLSIS